MQLNRFILCFLLTGLFACQKSTDGILPGDPAKPDSTSTIPVQTGVVYEKGIPTGGAVQKTIGPEGGTLASANGTLQLTIPAGAVAQATNFTIQSVTPTLPGLIGKQSFRLLPEGITFAKPVTLQFHYQEDELAGTSSQLLFMAYQGNDGIWKALPNTELDEATRTLTVNTTHFSDWGAFAEFFLLADREPLNAGESTNLTLVGYYDDLHQAPDAARSEVALTQQQVLQDPGKVRNWRVTGEGTVLGVGTKATYVAPGSDAPLRRAVVSVEVHDFIPPKYQPRKGATGKAIILRTIRIEGNWFEATLDGMLHDDCKATILYDYRGTTIAASITTVDGLSRPLVVHIADTRLRAGETYSFGDLPQKGKATLLFTEGSDGWGDAWVHYYDPCDGDGIVISPGGVHIDSIEGEVARGSLDVVLYSEDNCNVKIRTLSAKFKLRIVKDF